MGNLPPRIKVLNCVRLSRRFLQEADCVSLLMTVVLLGLTLALCLPAVSANPPCGPHLLFSRLSPPHGPYAVRLGVTSSVAQANPICPVARAWQSTSSHEDQHRCRAHAQGRVPTVAVAEVTPSACVPYRGVAKSLCPPAGLLLNHAGGPARNTNCCTRQ